MKNKIQCIFIILAIVVSLSCKKPEEIGTTELNKTICTELLQKYSGNGAVTSKRLNSEGYDLYKKKRYEEAADLFRCAVMYDDGNEYAHYNLACTLSLMYGQGKVAGTNEIFIHLEKSIKLEPQRILSLKKDSDLNAVRGLTAYALLVGNSIKCFDSNHYNNGKYYSIKYFESNNISDLAVNANLPELPESLYYCVKYKSKYYLQIGKFLNREDAVSFAKFCNYSKKNIVALSIFDDSIDTIEKLFIKKTYPSNYYLYQGKIHQLVIIYKYVFAFQGARQPSTMDIYLRDAHYEISNVTGYCETSQGVAIGRSLLICNIPTNDEKENIICRKNIIDVSEKTNIANDIINDNQIYFDEVYKEARVTVFGVFDIITKTMKFHPKLGFDYYDNSGEIRLKKGTIVNSQTAMGNYLQKKIFNEREQILESGNSIIITKKNIEDDEEVNNICILFIKK